MKIQINYDLIQRITEAKKGFSLVHNAKMIGIGTVISLGIIIAMNSTDSISIEDVIKVIPNTSNIMA